MFGQLNVWWQYKNPVQNFKKKKKIKKKVIDQNVKCTLPWENQANYKGIGQ